MAKYILKQEAIFVLANEAKIHNNPLKRAYTRAAALIEQIKAEDVQPVKHGRWENEYLEDDDVWWADCTNCKNDSHSRYGRVSIYAYCPNCGARMIKDGEQND